MLEKLSLADALRLQTCVQWTTAILTILAALSGILALMISSKVSSLKKVADEATETRISKAESEVKNAKSEAVAAAQRADALELRLAPRVISKTQLHNLEAGLKRALSEGKATAGIIVASAMFDVESEHLAEQIFGAIKTAKWDTRISKTSAATFSGIRIVSYGAAAAAARNTVQSIFHEAGINFGTEDVPINQCGDQTTPAVYVWVGKK